MGDVITLNKDRLGTLAEDARVAAGLRDSGEPAEQMFCERLAPAAAGGVFTSEQWEILNRTVDDAEAWLQDEVIPAFFELLDLQEAAADDEELMDSLDPFLSDRGEMLVFLAVLRDMLQDRGIVLNAEGTEIPQRPWLPDEGGALPDDEP